MRCIGIILVLCVIGCNQSLSKANKQSNNPTITKSQIDALAYFHGIKKQVPAPEPNELAKQMVGYFDGYYRNNFGDVIFMLVEKHVQDSNSTPSPEQIIMVIDSIYAEACPQRQYPAQVVYRQAPLQYHSDYQVQLKLDEIQQQIQWNQMLNEQRDFMYQNQNRSTFTPLPGGAYNYTDGNGNQHGYIPMKSGKNIRW